MTITSIVFLVLTGGALIASVVFPVHVPQEILSGVEEFMDAFWILDGFIPVQSWMADFAFMLFIGLMYAVFRIGIGILALGSGGGKPEV